MKKTLFIIFCIFTSFSVVLKAQTASGVLDEASKRFNQLKSLKSVYYLTIRDGSQTTKQKGCIIMQGTKYVNSVGKSMIWFDGKTMWSLDRDDQEVTITSPSKDELTSNNPYYFLQTYKQDFNVALTNNYGNNYEVTMTPQKPDTNLEKFIIRISKTDFRPTQITMLTNKVTMVVDLQTYTTNGKYKKSSFSFVKSKYPNVDIIDLR